MLSDRSLLRIIDYQVKNKTSGQSFSISQYINGLISGKLMVGFKVGTNGGDEYVIVHCWVEKENQIWDFTIEFAHLKNSKYYKSLAAIPGKFSYEMRKSLLNNYIELSNTSSRLHSMNPKYYIDLPVCQELDEYVSDVASQCSENSIHSCIKELLQQYHRAHTFTCLKSMNLCER
jgi:hypothetical protein